MDITTTYLGMKLANPLMPGASPLGADLDLIRRLEDAGAPAIVLPSLFEEQCPANIVERWSADKGDADWAATQASGVNFAPEDYLAHLRRVKAAVNIPVIASLNGSTYGGWLRNGRLIEEAGADALELNVYAVETNPSQGSLGVEMQTIEMVLSLKRTLRIPFAVKLSPFYTALAHFAHQLDIIDADGLILFNRFYQPDIDPDLGRAEARLQLSTQAELPLRLRWLAILSGRVKCSLAATGGVHDASDAIKAIMAGASVVQVVSALITHGPEYLRVMLVELEAWMRNHGVESLGEIRGRLSLERGSDPRAFERANYIKVLQGWGGEEKAAAR